MSRFQPHVPCFGVLSISTSLSFSLQMASIPLLPLLLPSSSSTPFHLSIILTAFTLPSFFLPPLILSKSINPPITLLIFFASILQTIGPFLLAILSAPILIPHLHLSAPILHILISLAFLLSGTGASLIHATLLRLVDLRMRPHSLATRRNRVGVHCAALEACISVTNMVAPVVFATFASHRHKYLFVPFLTLACAHLVLAPYIAYNWPLQSLRGGACQAGLPLTRHEREDRRQAGESDRLAATSNLVHSYGAVSSAVDDVRVSNAYDAVGHAPMGRKEAISSVVLADVEREEDMDRGVWHALRHPWVWMILFTALATSASSTFLRPLLVEKVVKDLHGSVMFVGVLFSLWALVRLLSESISLTLLSRRIGVRAAGVVGFVVTVFGFHVLGKVGLLSVGFLIIAVGTGMGAVVTVTDLAITTRTDVDGVTHSLSLLASFTFVVGDVVGLIGGGYLYEVRGSFERSVESWTRFLTIGCAVVMTPYVLGKLVQWLGLWGFLAASVRTSEG